MHLKLTQMLYVNYFSNLERKTKDKCFELQKAKKKRKKERKNRSNYGTFKKELLNYTHTFQKYK